MLHKGFFAQLRPLMDFAHRGASVSCYAII